jgi:hypothetical protein
MEMPEIFIANLLSVFDPVARCAGVLNGQTDTTPSASGETVVYDIGVGSKSSVLPHRNCLFIVSIEADMTIPTGNRRVRGYAVRRNHASTG